MADKIINAIILEATNTEAVWIEKNPVLRKGQLAISSDKNGKYKVGNGTSTWTQLSYAKADLASSDVTTALGFTPATSNHTHNLASTSANGYLRQLDGSTAHFLRGDGTWATPPAASVMKGATASAAGAAGLVPAPAVGKQASFLRGDGTWQSISLSTLGVTVTAAELNYMDGVTSNVQTQLNGKAATSHTHNYAGSSSAGGAANSVKTSLIIKLNGGATEGTNLFTFNGSAAKTVNITASSIGAATSSHTHTKAQITDFPTSLKNPAALTIQFNGTSQGAYDGSAAKTVNITAASIGAATSGHTHSYLPLSGGTLTGQLTVAHLVKITAQGASEGGELQLLKGNDAQARDVHIDAIAHRVRFYCGDDGQDYTGFDWDYVDDMFYLNYSGLTVRDGITAANSTVKISSNHIDIGTKGVMYSGGRTGSNASICITGKNSSGNYHPIMYGQTLNNHMWNIGSFQDQFGVYGFYSGTTENLASFSTLWNVSNGQLTHNGVFIVNNKVRIWGDNEGGNIRLYSPTGDTYYEMDAVENAFRLYYSNPYKVIFQTNTSGNLNVPGSMSTPNLTVTGITCNSHIEMYGTTPFIDFHYNKSTADYTARIIADTSNRLCIQASGGLQINNGLSVSGTIKATSEMFQTISGETWHWGPSCGTGVATRFGIRRQSNGYTFYFDGATGGMYLGGVIQAGGGIFQSNGRGLLINNNQLNPGEASIGFGNGSSATPLWTVGMNLAGQADYQYAWYRNNKGFAGWITYDGELYMSNNIIASGRLKSSSSANASTTSAANAYFDSTGGLYKSSASSRRYKYNITENISAALDPTLLYNLPVVQYQYNPGYLECDPMGVQCHIGFIAEDVADIYPVAAEYNPDGTVEMWNFKEILPGMLKLVQDQHTVQEDHEKRIAELEAEVAYWKGKFESGT